jgi:L-fuconolactonase
MNALPVIDAHQHFWQRSLPFNYDWLTQPALAAINRDFLPADLDPPRRAAGVDATIFVQTQHNLAENDWVLQLADENPWIAGVVGWVDLQSPACEEQLLRYRAHPKFVGVRHVTHDEPDDDWIIRPTVLAGLRALERHSVPFDLLFFAKHLHHAPAVARAVPNATLVIDHLSKPRIQAREIAPWAVELRAAAAFPNMYCKLSGLVTEADWRNWSVADLKPYFQTALEAFGPARLLFGTDWPVCVLAADYARVVAATRELIAELSASEQAAILGGNAARVYQLKLGAEPVLA